MANELALDIEATTHNKGSPHDPRNKMVCWSYANATTNDALQWPKFSPQFLVNQHDLLVGFNFKYDYHWFAREGVALAGKDIWDVQIAEFILSNQTHKFPSLNETCVKYGVPTKLDIVASEYWAKEIQTDLIPWDVLKEYSAHDAKVTLMCYHAQLKLMSERQKQLCRLMCMDMHVLREMEATGLAFDEDLCVVRAKEVDDKIAAIKQKLTAIYPNVPVNFGSGDDLSAFLYGGQIKEDAKEHVGFYKGGVRAGQPKYKNVVIEHTLPRLYEPLKGSALKKEGMYATDEGTLRKLKGKKDIVSLLLELSKLEKLNGTYYKGLTQLRETMHWPVGELHGQFNQTSVATGRLSSNKPNLQNFASELQDIFISRYSD